MPAYDFDIGVIGGGAAGLTVAAGSARLGAKTLLIEKEPHLGGDCLHFGCVPSKTLIRSSRIYHQARNLETFGLPGVEVPPVDFKSIAARIQQVIGTIQKHDSVQRFCSLGARVEFGDPEFVDEHSIDLAGSRYSARTWVLATGSSPAVPDIPGLDRVPYLTNRDLFSLDSLPGSLIILGAGPVAAEMAQAFARLGSRVQVIQRSGQILSREDPDLAEAVQSRLVEEGVVFHLEAVIEEVRTAESGIEVAIQGKDKEQTIVQGDQLLVALGRVANCLDLKLERAGVAFTAKGIASDARMRSNQKHIYAAGDVTGTYLFTHAAGYEGGIVVSNAVFHLPRKADYTNLPWCTYTDPELASIGLNEKRAREQNLEYSLWSEDFAGNDRSLAEGQESGRIKMLLSQKGKPLGVQIFGPRAGELLSEWVAVFNGGVRLSTLAGAVHPYPTLAEINKGVVGRYMETRIFSEKVQKTLRFFFNFKGRACGKI
ncbi:MAG: FAD-dependent oxidoreductase [Desulfohalobiaceae bacterium]|nr:FAD-dependent oxidoreductase [Desulfohalobiaceae bacterium]